MLVECIDESHLAVSNVTAEPQLVSVAFVPLSRRNPIQYPTNTERPNQADANKIQGVDFHPEFQQMALVDTDTGEFLEKRLAHREEAEQFYRDLAAQGRKVRVGMEASGH